MSVASDRNGRDLVDSTAVALPVAGLSGADTITLCFAGYKLRMLGNKLSKKV